MSLAKELTFDSVSMEFPVADRTLHVVDQVSFSISPGEFVSLVGPSGCGKTTLLSMAAGFLRPSEGTVMLGDTAIAGPGPDRGVMFQEYGVFPWLTVEQNVAFGLSLKSSNVNDRAERELIVTRYLMEMGLTEFRRAYPRTLSGGMRQRLALARAYAVSPSILLMDEPFGALDAQTRSAMHDLLLNSLMSEPKSVMLITHAVEEAIYLSNRVIVISARPSRIRAEITIPFAYPRGREIQDTLEFAHLRSSITELVMREYALQEAQGRPA